MTLQSFCSIARDRLRRAVTEHREIPLEIVEHLHACKACWDYFDTLAIPPKKNPIDEQNDALSVHPGETAKPGTGYMVVIRKWERNNEVTLWKTEIDARLYEDTAGAQWSESFVCRVLKGPRDATYHEYTNPFADDPAKHQ
jgi:hypothetical protein